MNLSTSTTTRVTLPAATRPPESDGGDGERDPAPFDLVEVGLGHDLGADRSGLQVVDLDPHADRGRARIEPAVDGVARGFFQEGDEPRCAEHVDLARAERTCGVGIADDQPRLALESRCQVHGPSR